MRNLTVLAFLVLIVLYSVSAQPANVNAIFEKYSGKEGFTSLQLSDPSTLISGSGGPININIEGVSSIKVLVFNFEKQKNLKEGKDFSADLKKLSASEGYKDFMTVQEDGKFVKMLSKKSGEKFSEFITIVSGDDGESVLIWISGDLDMKNLSNIGNMINLNSAKKQKKPKSGSESK